MRVPEAMYGAWSKAFLCETVPNTYRGGLTNCIAMMIYLQYKIVQIAHT